MNFPRCGCGAGDELRLYKEAYHAKHVTGVDADAAAAAAFVPDYNLRLLHQPSAALRASFQPGVFNTIDVWKEIVATVACFAALPIALAH